MRICNRDHESRYKQACFFPRLSDTCWRDGEARWHVTSARDSDTQQRQAREKRGKRVADTVANVTTMLIQLPVLASPYQADKDASPPLSTRASVVGFPPNAPSTWLTSGQSAAGNVSWMRSIQRRFCSTNDNGRGGLMTGLCHRISTSWLLCRQRWVIRGIK